jgi:hypothetical protein
MSLPEKEVIDAKYRTGSVIAARKYILKRECGLLKR